MMSTAVGFWNSKSVPGNIFLFSMPAGSAVAEIRFCSS